MSASTSETIGFGADTPTPRVPIQSSDLADGADFYVYRAILALVSPVFETMLTLPQPPSNSEVPIIDMQEDAIPLDRALRFFYPATQPLVATLDELQESIEILISKFDMQCLIPSAKQHLERYIVSQPLAVYAVAFMHKWEDIGRVAAKECLKLALRVPHLETPPTELKYLTATAYYKLLHYHFQCAAAAKATTHDFLWIQNRTEYCWFQCNSCTLPGNVFYSDGRRPKVASWFTQFMAKIGDAVAVRPTIILREDPLFLDAIKTAVNCGTCRSQSLENLSSFMTVWETKLAEEIAKVEWNF
ncbi:hypothetical protein B0H14DRAFT_3494433 [Mycena olivaceomarginata]|nr:hypothetical protein B0H14DRAFT_3494433 [Mycena olivaceomarginata]